MKKQICTVLLAVWLMPSFVYATDGRDTNRDERSGNGNGNGKNDDKDKERDDGKGGKDDKDRSRPPQRVEVIDRFRTGPADYFNLYGSVRTTVIRHGRMHVRTVSGDEIMLSNPMVTLDLQDLINVGKGVVLALKGMQFPGGQTSLEIAEVWVELEPDAATAVNFANSASCDLKVPNRLSFPLSAPFLAAADDYYLKVAFAPLADIQMDRVITTSQEFLCPGGVWVPACVPIGPVETREKLNCTLSSHRLPVVNMVRRADEF